MKKRFISRWIVQKAVREVTEEMGILGATPELISEKVKELAGAYLPVSVVEKALEDMGDEFYAGEDEFFDEEYMARMKKERIGKVSSSISLVLAMVFFALGTFWGLFMPLPLLSYCQFLLAGSVILGFLTSGFCVIFTSKYITWKGAMGIIIALEAQLIYHDFRSFGL
jgi:hypothetical protein